MTMKQFYKTLFFTIFLSFNSYSSPSDLYFTNINRAVLKVAPQITVTSSFVRFVKCVGSASEAQTFTVSGSGLTSNIIITPPTGYEVSLNGTTWASSLTLSQTSGNVSNTTIYIRLTVGVATITTNLNVTISTSGDSVTKTVEGHINNNVTSGVIKSNQTICNGGDANQIKSDQNTANGGDGNDTLPFITDISYIWQQSTDGGITWSVISGANSSSYNPPAGSITVTTKFRRITVSSNLDNTSTNFSCQSIPSNVVTVTINSTITVSASANNNFVCVGQSINLSSNSNNTTVSYSWSGPNGFSSNQQNPTVSNSATVNMSGNYTVTASLGSGCQAQSTVNVKVLAPVGVVNPTLLNVCVTQSNPNPLAAMFLSLPSDISIISTISVNWGDGSLSQSIPSPWTSIITHAYPTGNYTVTITTTSTSGCILTKTYNSFIGSSPQAATLSLFANQATGCIPHTTQFTFGIPINNSNGTNYRICFGDASPCIDYVDGDPIPSNWVVGTSANGFNFYTISHIYSSTSCGNAVNLNGTSYSNVFLPSVVTTNPCSAPSSQAGSLISIGVAPTASFTPNPIPNICTNTPLLLTNTSNAGVTIDPITFACTQTAPIYWEISPSTPGLWTATGLGSNNSFPDNELFWSLGSNTPSITFLQPGTYTITLFVKNSCGLSQVSQQVCVENPLVPQFTLSGTEFCNPVNVTTTNTTNLTNNCSVTYQWNVTYADGYCGTAPPTWSYTNGTSATSANPSFSFETPGTYSITLTTTNSCGPVTTLPQTVIVKQPPTVAISSIPNICLGATVTPTISVNSCSNLALPTSPPAYSWTATGATPSTSNATTPPTFSYVTAGTYTISHSVTNECGTTNSSQSIVVNPIPIITGPSSVSVGQTITLTANSAGAATNAWVSSNTAIATVSTTGVVTGIAAGTATITFTNSSNCQTTANNLTIINNLGTNTIKQDEFILYPNPASDVIYLQMGANTQLAGMKVKVVNLLGQSVEEHTIQKSTTELSTKNWGAAGVYFVQITNSNNTTSITKKVMVERK